MALYLPAAYLINLLNSPNVLTAIMARHEIRERFKYLKEDVLHTIARDFPTTEPLVEQEMWRRFTEIDHRKMNRFATFPY